MIIIPQAHAIINHSTKKARLHIRAFFYVLEGGITELVYILPPMHALLNHKQEKSPGAA